MDGERKNGEATPAPMVLTCKALAAARGATRPMISRAIGGVAIGEMLEL
jgi:hypothetical protein